MISVRRIHLLSFAVLALATAGLPAAPARAQAPAETATPASPATPATPAAPATPAPPEAAGTPADAAAERAAAIKRLQAYVDELRAEVSYRVENARRIHAHEPMEERLKPEIGRTTDRGIDLVQTQLARVEKAAESLKDPKNGTGTQIGALHDELEAMEEIAGEAASDISNVLTRGGETEETLQAIAREIRRISEKAEDLADRVDRMFDENEGGLRVKVDINEREYGGQGDRVQYGSGVTVPAGERVVNAVAFGGPVSVEGMVDGDAVAFGGNVHVRKGGRVSGDAAAFGGRVLVDDGGKVEGEIVNFGYGKIGEVIAGAQHRPRVRMSTPARIGSKLLMATIQFVLFFFVGMLVLALVPERTERVAREIGDHPVKSAGFGVLLVAFVLPLLSVLLLVTIVGILPLVFVVVPGVLVAAFLGYVALLLLLGRKIPANVVPTRTALFALGVAIFVVVGMIPVLGPILQILAGFVGFGAVVMTRFGQPPENGETVPPPPAPPVPPANQPA